MSKVYDKTRNSAMTDRCRGTSFLCIPSAGPKPFQPVPGDFYNNVNGQTYQCIAPSDEFFCAVMENVKSGWRFVAHCIVQHRDGYIEWGFSTSGRFTK